MVLSRAMRSASLLVTFKQRRIFSVASRLRFLGKKIQIKLASPRPNVKAKFGGNKQIIALSNFKNLYSIEFQPPLSSCSIKSFIFVASFWIVFFVTRENTSGSGKRIIHNTFQFWTIHINSLNKRFIR